MTDIAWVNNVPNKSDTKVDETESYIYSVSTDGSMRLSNCGKRVIG